MTGTPATAPSVTPAAVGDAHLIAGVLGAAFADDPVGQWIAPDAATRVYRLTQWFEIEAESFTLPHGGVLRAGDAGAALWLPPGRWQVPPLLLVRTLPRLGRIFGRRTALLLRGLRRVEHEHPRQPHWYLPFIGVVPEHRSRGIGSALLETVLQRCDEDGTPAYLEATSERNRSLYLRHGFTVRGELPLPEGPTLWAMWREPRQASR
jgi:GNAT superfamily N-acetyltransferase